MNHSSMHFSIKIAMFSLETSEQEWLSVKGPTWDVNYINMNNLSIAF